MGGKGLDDVVGERFGQAPTFTIVDTETNDVEVIPNKSQDIVGGGYPPELLHNKGVDVVICSNLGDRVIAMFERFGIDVYIGAGGTVRDSIQAWQANLLQIATDKAESDDSLGVYPDEPVEVTDASLEEKLRKYPMIVVDCWAGWCSPCKAIEPVIEELAGEYSDKIVFGKLNVDKNRETPARFGVQSIPTLLIFKDGKLLDRIVGAVPKERIREMLDRMMG